MRQYFVLYIGACPRGLATTKIVKITKKMAESVKINPQKREIGDFRPEKTLQMP